MEEVKRQPKKSIRFFNDREVRAVWDDEGGNTALIRSQNVLDFSLSRDGLAYINEEQAQKLDNVSVSENDVLLNITGDSVARVCLAPSWALPARVNQHVSIIRGKSDIVLNCYLLYYLQYKKSYLLSLSQGGATRNALTKKMIEDIEIPLPTISYQEKVISILSALDDKIELNRRINDNLEQQAQALSKAWFVDFEPFKDGKFVNSELGRIPEGWKILCADEIYNINIGKTPPRKESVWFSETEDANIKWISISDLANCGTFVGSSSEYLTPQAINKFNIIVVPSDTVLLSFKLTIGRIAIAKCSLTTNEAIARFYLPNPTYREFTYLTLKNYDYSKLGSTSSIATAVNSKIIKNMKILFPNTKDIEKFHNTVKPIFDTIKSKSDEIDRLCELRDTLLPRLMSGELSINTITE